MSSGRWGHPTQADNAELPYAPLAEAHQKPASRSLTQETKLKTTTKVNQELKTTGYLNERSLNRARGKLRLLLGLVGDETKPKTGTGQKNRGNRDRRPAYRKQESKAEKKATEEYLPADAR